MGLHVFRVNPDGRLQGVNSLLPTAKIEENLTQQEGGLEELRVFPD